MPMGADGPSGSHIKESLCECLSIQIMKSSHNLLIKGIKLYGHPIDDHLIFDDAPEFTWFWGSGGFKWFLSTKDFQNKNCKFYTYNDLNFKYEFDLILAINEIWDAQHNGLYSVSVWCYCSESQYQDDGFFNIITCDHDLCVRLRDQITNRVAVDLLTSSYLSWRWRKEHLYNPHDPIGKRWLERRADRDCRDNISSPNHYINIFAHSESGYECNKIRNVDQGHQEMGV